METTPMPVSLPMPMSGSAIGEAGDAYVESLRVAIEVDGQAVATVTGTMRHIAFHPRTRALIGGSMKAPSFAAAVDRHWSSIDSTGFAVAGLTETADTMATHARTGTTISWRQVN